MPVPASRTRRPGPSSRLTHAVSPPYLTVWDPGVGMEPRVPQKGTRTLRLLRRHPEGREVEQVDFPAIDCDHVPEHEVAHRSGDGLPAGAHHLPDRGVRQPPGDPGAPLAASLPREIEQQEEGGEGAT